MPIRRFFICLSCLLFLLPTKQLFAQLLERDTLNVSGRYEVVGYTTDLESKKLVKLDTSLLNFHHFNPSESWPYAYSNLGNLGLANKAMRFSYDREHGFDSGFRNFSNFFFEPRAVPYFKVRAPLTDLYYAIGAREAQVLKLSHAQTVRKRHQVGLHYRRLVSDGRYQRQKSGVHAFSLSDWYQSKNKRYTFMAALVWNKATPRHNGGVSDTLLFSNYPNPLERAGQDIRLSNAESVYNEINYFIRQEYELGHTAEPERSDSTAWDLWKDSKQGNGFKLLHELHIKRSSYQYQDAAVSDDGFYQNNGFRTSPFRSWEDKWRMREIDNLAGLAYENEDSGKLAGMRISAGLLHEYSLFRDTLPSGDLIGFTRKDRQNNLALVGRLASDPSALSYKVMAKFGLLGSRVGDLELDGKVGLQVNETWPQLWGRFRLSNLSPAYLHNWTFMDNFRWFNDFNKERHALWQLGASWTKLGLDLSFSNHLLDNYIIYDYEARPIQLTNSITVQQFDARLLLKLGRFAFQPNLLWQNTGSDQIAFPELYLAGSAWYENNVFGDAMLLQLGIEASMWKAHRAYDYMPATNVFFLTENEQIEQYPLLSLFAAAKVKQARLFLSLSNLLMGFPDNGYYSVHRYPMQDRGLNFGVSWRFYD